MFFSGRASPPAHSPLSSPDRHGIPTSEASLLGAIAYCLSEEIFNRSGSPTSLLPLPRRSSIPLPGSPFFRRRRSRGKVTWIGVSSPISFFSSRYTSDLLSLQTYPPVLLSRKESFKKKSGTIPLLNKVSCTSTIWEASSPSWPLTS